MRACDCPSVTLHMPVHHRRVRGMRVEIKTAEAKLSSQNTGARVETKSWDKVPPTSSGEKMQETKTEAVDHREAWRLQASKCRPWELCSSS